MHGFRLVTKEPTSTLLALAIFRDNDTDAYAYQASKDLRFPQPGVSLTHLLLQALADPISFRQSSSRQLCWNWQ